MEKKNQQFEIRRGAVALRMIQNIGFAIVSGVENKSKAFKLFALGLSLFATITIMNSITLF